MKKIIIIRNLFLGLILSPLCLQACWFDFKAINIDYSVPTTWPEYGNLLLENHLEGRKGAMKIREFCTEALANDIDKPVAYAEHNVQKLYTTYAAQHVNKAQGKVNELLKPYKEKMYCAINNYRSKIALWYTTIIERYRMSCCRR